MLNYTAENFLAIYTFLEFNTAAAASNAGAEYQCSELNARTSIFVVLTIILRTISRLLRTIHE